MGVAKGSGGFRGCGGCGHSKGTSCRTPLAKILDPPLAKGLEVPWLFMITEESIRCQKNSEVGIRRIRVYPPIHHYNTSHGNEPCCGIWTGPT